MDKENLKSNLLQAKEFNEETWREINCCIFMEQVIGLSSNKEEALSKLRVCTNYTIEISHLCDIVLAELEKSTTDFAFVRTHSEKMDRANSQLKNLIADYKSLRKKPVEG